ncbi:MAG: HAMP domain-containing histidine kinase, partial [Paramuribaculum sp.]|nr:HAMP domain-containing histidine kinase [Paramuribaculum sp.]
IIAYYSTGFLTRNVKTLTEFANRAIKERNPDIDEKVSFDDLAFPDDELGDVSCKLVQLYADKIEALEKSEREHRVALHAVEEKSRIKRQLTNNINHELKTPIGVIRGYIDTILSSDDMDDNTRTHFLLRAQKNVDRLCSLLNDVSTMTRLEEGSGSIPVTDVNIHDLVYTLANDISVTSLAGNLKFKYDLPLDCVVKGNASLLSGMISNLIKNAALHSRGSEIMFNIVSETSKYYTFAFFDNGTGVSEEHLPHLFERFYRVDAGRSRRVGGTGLGLSIVKNTVEALGGTISIRNRAAGGLEFVFTLEKWREKY